MNLNHFTYIPIFATLIFTLSAFSIPDANAVSGTISDGSSCVAIVGTWDGVNTCTVSSLTVNPGETLSINPGITIKSLGTTNINQFGTINNTGTFFFYGITTNGGTINNSGTITSTSTNLVNYGFINNLSGSSIYNDGLLDNQSIIINNLGGNLNNYATLKNSKVIVNLSGGILTNNPSSSIINIGTISNSGTINNLGFITNNGNFNNGGTFTNSFRIDVENGLFINSGLFTNSNSSSVDISIHSGNPTMINFGTINNLGGIIDFSDVNKFLNFGTFNNQCGADASLTTYVNPMNNISCQAFPIIQMSDTTASFDSLLSSARQFIGEYASPTSSLVGKKIDSITLRMAKVGSPTGTAQVGVFDINRNVVKLFATVDVSTIATGDHVYEFKLPANDLYTIKSGDRIGIKYTGGSSSVGINVTPDRDAADPFDGANSYRVRYETAWITSSSEDMYMILKQTHG